MKQKFKCMRTSSTLPYLLCHWNLRRINLLNTWPAHLRLLLLICATLRRSVIVQIVHFPSTRTSSNNQNDFVVCWYSSDPEIQITVGCWSILWTTWFPVCQVGTLSKGAPIWITESSLLKTELANKTKFKFTCHQSDDYQ